VRPSTLVGARRITTGLWPGFPSDIVSLVTVLATQARGRTLLHDWMYELRLFALEQLSSMRADLFLCDPHRIIVTGRRSCADAYSTAADIRSGMALVPRRLRRKAEHRARDRDRRARLRESRRTPHHARRHRRATRIAV
jgi:UDP-N-acetylglucosamine 1-carboxyvinyltransferase